MKMDPFIEAEEAAGHSVKHCCDCFEVSRAAYYERRQAVPSASEVSDAELSEKISAIHTESKGTYGSPAGPQGAGEPRRRLRAAPGAPAHAPGRPRGPVQEALAQDDGARPGRRARPRT